MPINLIEKEGTVKFMPRVLLQAKEEANLQKEDKKSVWDNGPWDEGHWSNRK